MLWKTQVTGSGLAYLKPLPGGAVNLMVLADDLYVHERHELALAVYERVLAGAAEEDKPWLLFQIANCRRHTDVPEAALAAYGRTGEPCPVCVTPIAHCTAAGRSTHFCPRCQVLATTTKVGVKQPFDVPGVKAKVRTADIIAAVREVRSRAGRRPR